MKAVLSGMKQTSYSGFCETSQPCSPGACHQKGSSSKALKTPGPFACSRKNAFNRLKTPLIKPTGTHIVLVARGTNDFYESGISDAIAWAIGARCRAARPGLTVSFSRALCQFNRFREFSQRHTIHTERKLRFLPQRQ